MTMIQSAPPILSVEALSHSYGGDKLALDQLSFALRPGCFTALLGPNGAGKSTFFGLVTALMVPGAGQIAIDGQDLYRHRRQALAKMGVVFQQSTLDLDLTVQQNLRYFASLHGMSRRQADARIEKELSRFEMYDRRHEKVRQLNGGHRRRVEIARALLHEPAVLLLDEATVGLDVPSRKSIVGHVHRLCASDGVAVLWATHLIDEVYPTDQVIILDKGVIKAEGVASQLAHEFGSVEQAFAALTQATEALI